MLANNRKQCFTNTSGNVVIMVVILSMLSLTFFTILVGYSLKNLAQIQNLHNSSIVYFAAEGAAEKTIVEYFSKEEDEPYKTIEDEEEICTRFTDLGEAVIDFFNCLGGDQIGSLERKATRYRDRLEGVLDRYAITEYWFTDAELETNNDIADLTRLALRWNIDATLNESAPIEVILARWPKENSRDIQTSRVLLNPGESEGFIIEDFRAPKTNDPGRELNTEKYAYILFLKTREKPTHYAVSGLDRDNFDVPLPDKRVEIYVKAELEDKRAPDKRIVKSLFIQKDIYTDFDSNFEYFRYHIQ